mgnify:CR=1 FL=1
MASDFLGLTAVTESPDGADLTKLHADDMVYAGLRAAEEFKYTIESYMYPPEFEACDGSAEIVPGVTIGQQRRLPFGFSWVTSIGNDTVMDDDDGYIIHIAWNSTASPSEKSYETVNATPFFIGHCSALPLCFWRCSLPESAGLRLMPRPVPQQSHGSEAFHRTASSTVS